MSTGKKLYLDTLSEDNFSQLWDNSDGQTIIMNLFEGLYYDNFHDPDLRLDVIQSYKEKFEDAKPDVKWVTCGHLYPTEEEIWYGIKMPCPDMICRSPFPWAQRISYEMAHVANTINENNWPENVDVHPTKLFSCFINNIQGKDHRLAIMLSLCENEMLEKGIVRFCSNDQVWNQFINTRDSINEYYNKGTTHGIPNYYQVISDYLDSHRGSYFSEHKWGLQGSFDTEYQKGAVDIVTLTDRLVNIWCEKNFRPLLLGKPFVVIGAPNVHTRMLKKAGYEVYDEVFDTQLDNEIWDLPNKEKTNNPYNHLKHIRRRANYYTKMLSKLYDMDDTQDHIDHIWEITRPKAHHNLSNFLTRFLDDECLPEVLRDPEFKIQKSKLYNELILIPRMKLVSHSYYSKFISKEVIASVKQEYNKSGL